MSLQTRLGAFITAVGADIKTLTTDKWSKVSRPDDLIVSTGVTTPGDKMQWKRLSNGALVVQEVVQVSDFGGGAVAAEDYKSVHGAGAQGASMHLSAEDSAGTKFSRLSIIDSGSGSPIARRTVRASLHADDNSTVLFRKIISSDGSSDFVQKSEATNWTTVSYAANERRLSNLAENEVQYYKDAVGQVHFRGLLERTAVWTLPITLFTIPPTFRPANNVYMAVPASSGGLYRMVVNAATGVVTLDLLYSGGAGSNGSHMMMAPLMYRAEQ